MDEKGKEPYDGPLTKRQQWNPVGPDGRPRVRTIPPWIRDAHESDLEDLDVEELEPVQRVFLAQHHPELFSDNPRVERRDHFYHTSAGLPRKEPTSRWLSFARASQYPLEASMAPGGLVTVEWLNQNWTDYSQPWRGDREPSDLEGGDAYKPLQRHRLVWYKRMQHTLNRNPFIPLLFRLIVITFSSTALGLGSVIYQETKHIKSCAAQITRSPYCVNLVGTGTVDFYQDPSALMATVVDAIAVVYSLYITYDEYFSKPLGLRSARAKVRLVLLDLVFIVFQSANLSLSFESLTLQRGVCKAGTLPGSSGYWPHVCGRAEALATVLLVSLVAWLLTFTVSIFRLVERINVR